MFISQKMADVADGKLGHYTFVLYEFASPGDFMKVLRQAEDICHARNYKFVAHLSATEEPPFDTFFVSITRIEFTDLFESETIIGGAKT